jgi:pimeloyl-ACP methyl ester carboxylesterase
VTETFVPVPGGRLFVVDEGPRDGAPIHLLHAGIADLRSWDAVAPLLAGAGYRVIRHDARGFGRSETDDVEYSERTDVIAVLDALAVGQVALVGNSMGGSNAFDTAIETLDRFVAVVGVAAGLRGYEVESTADEETLFLEMEAVEAAIDASTGDVRAGHVEELLALETRFWMDGPGQPPDRVPAAIRDALTAMNRLHLSPGHAVGRRVPLRPPAGSRLDDVRCPVLAVAGGLDVSDVEATAHHLERSAPNARAVILPDVAHMIGMEAPDRLTDLVVDFLAPLPRWS